MSALRTLLVLAVAAGILVLSPGTSWACSCVSATPAEHARQADTVVDGTLKWISSNGIESTYGVQVDRVFKGRASEREKLVGPADAAACGLGSLAVEKRYLFFVKGRHPGQMKVSLCGGSALYDARTAAAVQAVTGEPTGPAVSTRDRGAVDPDQIQGTPWYSAVGTTVILGLVLGGLLLLARRSSRGR